MSFMPNDTTPPDAFSQFLAGASGNLENDPVNSGGGADAFSQFLTGGDAKADSATVSGLKSAATAVVPTGGAWAGAESGAAIGALIPGLGETGIGELGGAFVGAIAGSIAAAAGQKAVLDKAAPDFEQQVAVDEQAHPIASTIGSIAAALPMFEFNPGQTVKGVSSLWKMANRIKLDKADVDAAMALAAQAGMGAGGAVVSPLVQGQTPDLKDIGISTLQALILGKPRLDIFKTSEALGIPPPEGAKQQQAPPPPGNQAQTEMYNPHLPPEQQADLTALAGRQAAKTATDEDMVQVGNITAGGSDVHPDAPGFYQQALAAARHKLAADHATGLANQQWNDEYQGGTMPEQTPWQQPNLPESKPAENAKEKPAAGTEGQLTTSLAGGTPSGPVAEALPAARAATETAPTEAQKEAGNYSKGEVNFDGMKIAIENPLGSERTGTGPDGKPWSVKMPVDYGYIKGTEGADGDKVDVSIGPDPDKAKSVFVIDQVDPKTGKFDETKSFIGFLNQEAALNAYRASFSDGSADGRIGAVTEMPRDQFKDWAQSGKASEPVALGKAPAAPGFKKFPNAGVGSPADEYGAIYGPTLTEAQIDRFKNQEGHEFPMQSEDGTTATLKVKPSMLWMQVDKPVRTGSSEVDHGIAYMKIRSDGSTVLDATKFGRPLDKLAADKLVEFLKSTYLKRADESTGATKETASIQLPAWQSIKAAPDELDKLTTEGNAGVIKSQGKTGAGTKDAQVYSEDVTPESLYKDSKAGGGLTKKAQAAGRTSPGATETRKLVAFQSPDGSHVMLSGVYKSQSSGKMVDRVTAYGSDGKPNVRKFEDLTKEGWKPLAGVKVDEPQKGFVRTYTPEEWAKEAQALRDKASAGQRTAEAVGAKIAEGTEYGRAASSDLGEPTGDEKVADHEATGAMQPGEEFTGEHADAIYDAISGAVKKPEDVADIIESAKRAKDADTLGAMNRAMVQLGFTKGWKTEADVAAGMEKFTKLIYEHYKAANKSGEKFSGTLTKAVEDAWRSQGPVPAVEAGRPGADEGAKELPGEPVPAAGANENPGGANAGQNSPGDGSTNEGANAAGSPEPAAGSQPGQPGDTGSGGSGGTESGSIGDNVSAKPAGDLTKLDFWEAKKQGIVSAWRDAQVAKLVNSGSFPPKEAAKLIDDGIKNASVTTAERYHKNEDGEPDFADDDDFAGRQIRNRIAQAKDTILRSRPSEAYIATAIHNLVVNLQNLGITTKLLAESISGMEKDCGKYEEWKNARGDLMRAITVSLSDTQKPTLETLKALLHEAAHAVFAKETPVMQARLHEAIEQATNERLGIGNFVEKVSGRYMDPAQRAKVAQEGRLAETVMKNLVEKGFDPGTANSVMQRVGNAVKAMYTRAAIAIQQAMGYKPSPELALKYFESRMRLALTGTKADSLISTLGGPRVTYSDPDSMESAQNFHDYLVRNKDIRHTSDQLETAVPGIENPTLEKQPDFVAENIVKNVILKSVDAFTGEGHNDAGLTPEQIVSRMGLGDAYQPGETPATRTAAANLALQRNGYPTVDPNIKIEDIKNEAVRKQAAAKSIGALQGVQDGWAAKAREAKLAMNKATTKLERNTKPLGEMVKDYTNVQLMASQAALRMQDLIQEQRDSFTDIGALSDQKSKLEQVLRQIDSQIKGDTLPQHYTDALNSLYSKLSKSGGDLDFQDMLQRVAGDEMIHWDNPAEQIARQLHIMEDPAIAPLLQNTPESKALLATVITFAKKNDHMMGLLQLRQSTALDERAQINKALQLAMQKHSSADSEARAMVAKLSDLKALGNRLLDSIKEVKTRNHELVDEIERQQKTIHFQNLADPIITQAIRPLESMIGALRTNVVIGPETDVRIPLTANSRPEQFLKKTLSLKVEKDGSITTPPEVRDALTKMRTWLDANEGKKALLGADYNEIQTTYDKLSNHLVAYGAAEPIKQLWVAKFLAPTAERLRMVNTPMTRSLAAMIENTNSLMRKYRNDAVKHSHEWEVRRGAAMKALGFKNAEAFKQCVTDAFKDYSSKNHDLRAKFATNEEATNAAVRQGIQNLRIDERTSKLMDSPRAVKAVEDFFRKTVEVNAWRANNGREMGNKVLDPKLSRPGKPFYRDVIGSEAFEFPRGLSDRADGAWKEMAGQWNGDRMDPKKIQTAYAQDKNALSESLAPRFNAKTWQGFVKWVCYKDGASAFSTPLRKDGTYDYASRDNVIKAYENSKDPVSFAENLYRLESNRSQGYSGDVSAFVGDTMHSLQSQWDLLTSMRGDVSENNDQRALPTPKRHIMDARLTDAGPREFYDYIDDDRSNLGNMVRAQAYNSAMGRRLEGYYQTMAAAEEEQRNYVQQYDNMAADPSVGGRFKDGSKEQRKAVLQAAKEQGLNVRALEEAHANLQSIKAASRQMQGYLSQNQGRPPELSMFSELMSGIGSLTVSGPGTAFIAHTIAFENSLRKFGLNTDGLGMMADTAKSSVGVALRGFMQTFGHQMALNAEDIKALERNGLSNPPALMKMSDQVKAIFVSPDYVHNVLGRGAIYAGRSMKLLAERVSAFHYLARVIQQGNSVAWANKLKSVIGKGIEHFEANPQDKANPDFNFKAKQLGISEGRAFDYFKFAMGKYGLDLRQMVEDAMARRASGKNEPLLTDDIYRKIAQASLDDMTLESSPTTRPAFLMNNSLGQLSNPMLGWTLHKTYDVVRSMREPDGQHSLNGYKTAMLAYAAMLPMAMSVAYIRNKFDEDIAGKKQNVSDLSTISSPEDAFKTMVDNAARVGTFGIAGEFLNMAANRDNARPMALDGRLFFLNTLENTASSVVNMAVQRDLDYQTVIRPLFQSLGGNGFYQYAGIINHTLGLDNAEARTMDRISVNNYLRVAGRQTNLDVRTYMGMMQSSSSPTPWRPAIGNMVLSAYANDAQGFNDAKKEAIDKMVEGGYTHEAALKKVVQSFEDSNPLKIVFRSTPSQQEYQKMLANMDDQGRQSVATAMRLFGHYAQQIGGNASLFGRGGSSVQRADQAAQKGSAWTVGNTLTRTSTGDDTLDAVLSKARRSQQ